MPDDAPPDPPEGKKFPDVPVHLLKTRLARLCRVKDELWEECQPVPPELEAKIREVSAALGRK